jgi:hypothetical protein
MDSHKSEQELLKQMERLKIRLHSLMIHCREETKNINHSQAQMLYGTTAEVLGGLVQAFDACEKNIEDGWLAAGRADINHAKPRQAAPQK